MRRVVAIGIGQTAFGKFPGKSVAQLGREAAAAAIADAGVRRSDIGVAYAAGLYGEMISAQVILAGLGISGIEMMNVENACAAGSSAVRAVWKDIAAGFCDVGIALGVESMSASATAGKLIAPGRDDLDGELGMTMPAYFALIARRLMHTHAASPADFAQVSVKAHRAGALNPLAHYRNELTVEQVLASRMIADPITLLQCCPTTDGAAAVVLAAESTAARFGGKPVRILSSVLGSGEYMHRKGDLTSFAVGRKAADAAYEAAGVDPTELDVVEVHDAFAAEELVHYEDLRLCGDGDAVGLLRSGATSLGGRVPVNPSGGLLAMGHPLGASGVRNFCEIVMQLRGDAGPRQKEGARLGLAQMLGGSANGLETGACAIHVLASKRARARARR